MYRITDERETNALIAAIQRGIPVRVMSDTFGYRTPKPAVAFRTTSTGSGRRAFR